MWIASGLFAATGQNANDTFASRQELEGNALWIEANNSQASTELDDPSGLQSTLWWGWTASVTGRLSLWIVPVEPNGPFGKAELITTIYRGPDFEHLEKIAATPEGILQNNRLLVDVQSGEKLFWVVGTPSSSSHTGPFQMFIQSGPKPLNDDYSGRLILQGEIAHAVATNSVATTELHETHLWTDRSLWWAWRAPRDGFCTLQASASSGMTRADLPNSPLLYPTISVFQGEKLGQLYAVNAEGSFTSAEGAWTQFLFKVVAGEEYRIRVGGGFGLDGRIELTLAMRQPPLASLNSAMFSGPVSEGEMGDWILWGSSSGGRVTNLMLRVDSNPVWSFDVSASSWVWRTQFNRGSFGMRVTATDEWGLKGQSETKILVVRPRNDEFKRRERIQGGMVEVPVNLINATVDPDIGDGLWPNVWWSWISPTNGTVSIQLLNPFGSISVYEINGNAQPVTLIQKPFQYDQTLYDGVWQETFLAVKGAEYAISVSGGDRLRILAMPPPKVEFKVLDPKQSVFVGDTVALEYISSSEEGAVSQTVLRDSGFNVVTNEASRLIWDYSIQYAGSHSLEVIHRDANGLFARASAQPFSSVWHAPVNDDYEKRIAVSEGQTVDVDVNGATSDGREAGLGLECAWWEWTASKDGIYQFWLTDAYCNSSAAVFEGVPDDRSKLIGYLRVAGGQLVGNLLEVNAKAGTSYSIAIGKTFCPLHPKLRILKGAVPKIQFVAPQPNSRNELNQPMSVEVKLDAEPGQIEAVELRHGAQLLHRWSQPPYVVEVNPEELTAYYALRCEALDHEQNVQAAQDLIVKIVNRPPDNNLFEKRALISGAPIRFQARLGDALDRQNELGGRNVLWWEWTPDKSGLYSFGVSNWWYTFQMSLYESNQVSGWVLMTNTTSPTLTQSGFVGGNHYLLGLSGDSVVDCSIVFGAPLQLSLVKPTGLESVARDETFPVQVQTQGSTEVEAVDFYQDDLWVGRISNPPYQTTFRANHSGMTKVQATARDRFGFFAYSQPVYQNVNTTPLVNDHFAQATSMTGRQWSVLFQLGEGTLEPLEPALEESLNTSAWWSWTSPGDGGVALLIQGTGYPMKVGVFTGSRLENLNWITTSSLFDAGFGGSVRFSASAGVTYRIRVASNLNLNARGGLSLYLDQQPNLSIKQGLENEVELEEVDSLNRLWELWVSEDLRDWRSLGWSRAVNGRWNWREITTSQDQRFFRVSPEFRIAP